MMTKNKLKKIFSGVLGVPEERIVSDLTPANTPSWDSLNAIILMTEIEGAFGLKFSFEEAMAVKSFSDALDLVQRKEANKENE